MKHVASWIVQDMELGFMSMDALVTIVKFGLAEDNFLVVAKDLLSC